MWCQSANLFTHSPLVVVVFKVLIVETKLLLGLLGTVVGFVVTESSLNFVVVVSTKATLSCFQI